MNKYTNQERIKISKIGLEDWVYPEGETVSDDALLEELYSEPITIIDNNAWMGNMTQALGGDDG